MNTECPGCSCEVGEAHYQGCKFERCSICGHQRSSCNCYQEMVWTGRRPGLDDCDRLNLWSKKTKQENIPCRKEEQGASEDLRSLREPICQWDPINKEWGPGPGYEDRMKMI